MYVKIMLKMFVKIMLKMFVNRVLRKVFGPKREEITGGWTELCNMGHHKLHLPPHITS
jgi:hypothetical protein